MFFFWRIAPTSGILTPPSFLLLEDGFNLLLEDGSKLILE